MALRVIPPIPQRLVPFLFTKKQPEMPVTLCMAQMPRRLAISVLLITTAQEHNLGDRGVAAAKDYIFPLLPPKLVILGTLHPFTGALIPPAGKKLFATRIPRVLGVT